MLHLEGFVTAVNSGDLWYSFDDRRTYTNDEVQRMVRRGTLKESDISSNPKVFPVVGNMRNAVSTFLPAMENALWLQQNRPTGCHEDLLYGPKYQSNSCFMDSTLMAMFAIKGSPFTEYLLARDVPDDGQIVCSTDGNRGEDRQLRLRIQNALREEFGNALTGKAESCTEFRRLIGRVCRPGPNAEDFSGTSDPLELYSRVLDVCGYKVMEGYDNPLWAVNEDGEFAQPEYSQPQPLGNALTVQTIGLRPNDIFDVIWQAFNDDFYNLASYPHPTSKEYTHYRKQLILTRADALVINIGRRNYELKTNVDYRQMRVYDTLEVPVDGKPTTFILRSAVWSSASFHYSSYISCGDKWYLYDDLNVQGRFAAKNELFSDAQIKDHSEVMLNLSTKGNLLFYFRV